MAYSPNLSNQSSFTMRRLAWALQVPMTKALEEVIEYLPKIIERGSVMLTGNLPFSKWEQIFKDPMVTVAAIDRLVHHST